MRIAGLIAEDEAPQRRELRALLAQMWPELDVTECADGLAALEAVESLRPRVAFLDIRMPGISGLEVAKSAVQHGQVIFTTAYEQHAVQAFEAGAVDYVLKPIEPARLRQVVERVKARLPAAGADLAAVVLELQGKLAARQDWIKWISASIGARVHMFSIDEVLFFQADEKYTRVVTATEDAQIRTPLRELLPVLDPDVFWQVHRGVIVRVGAIRHVRKDDEGRLHLSLRERAETLPVSSAFRQRFRGM
jgi:DNA-binding LytR/AlgR family response regulator